MVSLSHVMHGTLTNTMFLFSLQYMLISNILYIFQSRIIQFSNLLFVVPTQAPGNLSLTAKTSISIEASWQLPPAEDRNGIITGFTVFYKKNGSSDSFTQITINSGSTLKKVVSGLDEYTEYEFQVLAFTAVGDGPKSSTKTERTKQDGEET